MIIQIDSNAWAGQHINPKDPNPQNANGKLLQQFLQSNPALTVVNSLQSCEGSITRHRKTTAGEENSVLSTRATFTDQVSSFEKTMNQIYHQAFPKICEKKRKFKEDNVGYLVEKRKILKKNPSSEKNDMEIDIVENKILEKTEDTYAERAFEAIGNMTGEAGKKSNMGAWRELTKIDPNRKKKQLLPTAFKDKYGNMITNHEGTKNHCLNNIISRLRKRPMHPELKSLEKRKLLLSKLRLLKAKRRKSKPWKIAQMEKAILSMKKKKC